MSRLDDLFADVPEKMGVDDVATLLGLNPRTVSNWLKDGQLPGYKLPGRWLILREELRDYLAQTYTGYALSDPDADETER